MWKCSNCGEMNHDVVEDCYNCKTVRSNIARKTEPIIPKIEPIKPKNDKKVKQTVEYIEKSLDKKESSGVEEARELFNKAFEEYSCGLRELVDYETANTLITDPSMTFLDKNMGEDVVKNIARNLAMFPKTIPGLLKGKPNYLKAMEYINAAIEIEPKKMQFLELGFLIARSLKDEELQDRFKKQIALINPKHIINQSMCFIATATYGNSLAPEVVFFRSWRDTHLNKNILGKIFIKLYYRCSPPLASWISESDNRRSKSRFILNRIMKYLRRNYK